MTFLRLTLSLSITTIAAVSGGQTAVATTPVLEWQRVLTGSSMNIANGVALDGLGNVYMSGGTVGDAFVASYDVDGNQKWLRQFGQSGGGTDNNGIAADQLGNVYLTGGTFGDFGGSNAGSIDAYVATFSSAGSADWVRQLGTTSIDVSRAISVDTAGNAYIAGQTDGPLTLPQRSTRDAFLAKFDTQGNQLWIRQLGTSTVGWAKGVSANSSGGVFITGKGIVTGPIPTLEGNFVAKYDAVGNQVWVRQLGAASLDVAVAVAADDFGNVYVTGVTYGKLGDSEFGSGDAFVRKYDAIGDVLWTKQFGTDLVDFGSGVFADQQGNVYTVGETRNNPNGGPVTDSDLFVVKFDADGNTEWTYKVAAAGIQGLNGVAADSQGHVYAAGYMSSSPQLYVYDSFLIKLTAIPEPAPLTLCILCIAGVAVVRFGHGSN